MVPLSSITARLERALLCPSQHSYCSKTTGVTSWVHLSRIKPPPPPESSQDMEDLGRPKESRWMREPLEALTQEGQRNVTDPRLITQSHYFLFCPLIPQSTHKITKILWRICILVLLDLLLALGIFYEYCFSSAPIPKREVLCPGWV